MSETYEITNVAKPRRMLVLNLTKHAANREVRNTVTVENRQGERRQKVVKHLVPEALRIPVGKTVSVSRAIVECPEVQKAKGRREIKIKSAAPVASVPQKKRAKRRK